MENSKKKPAPQQQGRLFENKLASKLGAETVPGSGNQPFQKLDIEGAEFLVSCKWTDNSSIRLDASALEELQEASRGLGGNSLVPLLAARVAASQNGAEKVYAVLDLDDFISLLQEGITLFKQSKREAKYDSAETPSLFRQ